jgi:hypothetical protein
MKETHMQDIPDDDAIRFRVRNARLIAAFFLDFLDSDQVDTFYPHKVHLCRYDEVGDTWRPIGVDHDKLIADFVTWCQEE